MAEDRGIVIIGGSAAGFTAAQAIAGASHPGPVTLISAERRLPYKRTKISKGFAAGFEADAFALLEHEGYEKAGIELLLGRTVASVDLTSRTIALDDGSDRHWDRLVLATGAQPRCLPVAPAARDAVFFAHDIAQVEALRKHATQCESALVVGLGVLGIEVAEQLGRMGKRVTMAGDTSSLMTEHLNEAAARRLTDVMRDHGVSLLFGQTVEQIGKQGDHVVADLHGSTRSFDMIVCCIGLQVRAELARQAGLAVRRGIVVNEGLWTSHPDVLAAGDVAEHPDGRMTHLWRHALHQGRVAGLNAAGGTERYELVPFRIKCQVFDHYFFALQRPEPASLGQYEIVEYRDGARYVCCYYRDGGIAGVVMCDDEAHQKVYNQAVVERWPRAAVERRCALR